MRVPDEAMPVYYELLLEQEFDPARPAVESKRAMARALAAGYHGDEAAEAAEAHFDRLHVERGAPDEVEEFAFSPTTPSTFRPCSPTPSGSPGRRAAGS